jgi:outer membrane protein assembly factor BamC
VRLHRPILAAALLVAATTLAGCKSAQEVLDNKVDYKSERVVQPLEIPPDLTAPQGDNRYVVPDGGPSSATFSGYQAGRRDPRAPGTTLLPEFDSIRVERAGNQRWLVVQEAPEKLWPMVREFWLENGFLLKVELPEAGVMETDWAENRAKIPQGVIRDLLGKALDQMYSSSERDKFRTRLERAPDGKGTEIYVSHRGMQEVFTSAREANVGTPGQTAWTSRPPDPELETEFMRRLMARLGARGDFGRQLAVDAPAFRASISKSSAGAETLQVLEPFDRAWRRVGLALDRVGFTVEDRDRQKGLYFVRYADPEAESKDGFLTRLFGSSADKVKPEQYRVQVRQDGGNSQVNVLNKAGAADSSRTASRILSLLHEQLK